MEQLGNILITLSDHYLLSVLIGTVLVPVGILLLGIVMELIAQGITAFISLFTGGIIAFAIRTYATYLGTVIHELSHATFAFLTGAKVNRITLIPKGTTLGSVEYTPRGNKFFQGLQMSLSAIAPTVVGTALLLWLLLGVHPLLTEVWHYVLFYYVALSILFHMDLSLQDLRNFFAGIGPFLVLSFVVLLIAFGVFGTDWLKTLGEQLQSIKIPDSP